MSVMPIEKYKPFTPIELPDRTWPGNAITMSPAWCSVDLRDGNQALIEPMGPDRKLKMFTTLCKMGFKEIEVGFPSASETDFAFCRKIIDEGLIPDDVVIQVLTQSREELIRRTYEAIDGAKCAIVHLYNSTSTTQRRVVFNLDMAGITKIAVDGAQLIKDLVPTVPDTKIIFQYSPESFSATEVDYAVDVCEAVMDVWKPTAERPVILNLPAQRQEHVVLAPMGLDPGVMGGVEDQILARLDRAPGVPNRGLWRQGAVSFPGPLQMLCGP